MHQPRRRRSIRLRGYDYSQPGAYFVTICTDRRACLFGDIQEFEMQLNQIGQVVAACWLEIPQHFPTVSLDEWVVMPNHLHGILALEGIKVGHTPSLPDGSLISVSVGTRHASPLPLRYASSLSTIIGSFKAAVAKRVNALRGTPGTALWQRNYYEHVVRNEKSLIRIRQYIANNPAQWPEDPYNPLADGLNAEGPTVGTAR